MDNLIFLEPLTPSSSQPRLPGVRSSSNSSGPPSLSSRQITTQHNQRNAFSKDQAAKSRDMRDPSQESHSSDQRYRHQDQDSTQPSPNNDADFPSIDELLSGILQKNSSASAAPTDVDDDGFVDIDEVLSGTQQKRMIASANLNSGGKAVLIDHGTRGSSPADSSCSTGSSRDPIILSDDDCSGPESETDCSDLDVDARSKSDSNPPHAADSELAGGGFSSGAALISDRLVTDHRYDYNNHDGGTEEIQLHISADFHDQPPLTWNPTHTMPESTSDNGLDSTKAFEDEGFDVFAEGDKVDSQYARGRMLPAASNKNLPSGNDIPGLQDGPPDDPPSPELASRTTSPCQSDLKNGHLPKQLRRSTTRNDSRKHPRTMASIKPATTACTASVTPESTDLQEPESRVQITAPEEELELHDTDQVMEDDRSADDSDDEDYVEMSDAAGSKRPGRPHSRKRARRTKYRTHDDLGHLPSHPVGISCQGAAGTSFSATQESEEMPIHGYFTLKTVDSQVVYCLTFSQELLPKPSGTSQRQGIARSVSGSGDKRDSERTRVQERDMSRPVRNSRFSPKDDELLLQLKGEGLSWDEISDHFPERSKGTLQVHYSTKLKPRSETSVNTKKRWRSG